MKDATPSQVIDLASRRPHQFYSIALECDHEGVVHVEVSGQSGYSPENAAQMAAILRDAATILEIGDEC